MFTDFELAWFRKPLDEPRAPRRDPLAIIARRAAERPAPSHDARPPLRAPAAEGDPWFGV